MVLAYTARADAQRACDLVRVVELDRHPIDAGLGVSRVSSAASDAFAFIVGAVAWVELQVVGRLYLGELFLFACSLGLPLLFAYVGTPRERRRLAWFFALAALYLVGLVAADLYRGTPFTDYARGWARAVVYLGDYAGLLVLGYRRPLRLVLFVAGTAVSQLALTAFGLWPADWKFGYAYPLSVAVLVLVDSRKPVLSFIALTCLGLVHLLMDYRMFGAVCVVAAVVIWVKGSQTKRRVRAVMLAVGTIGAFVFLYTAGVGFGGNTHDLSVRRQGSNIERLAGLLVAAEIIRQSPIIGQGSWAKSDEALETWALLQEEWGSPSKAQDIEQRVLFSPEGAAIRAHSMILQAWVEAGLVGFLFFGYSLAAAVVKVFNLASATQSSRRDGLVWFFGLWVIWAMVMSPFAGVSRLYTAMSLSLLFVFRRGG